MLGTSYLKDKKESCNTLKKANKQLSKIAQTKLHELRFGIRSCSDVKNSAMLADLIEILEEKMDGSDCYQDYTEDQIKYIINKYI